MGTFHGKPSGWLMFDLSHSLRKNTNELLWLACVSLTDQFVHERLTDERYQAGVMELEQHINSSGNLEAVSMVTLKDGTKIRAPESSRIAYEDEPRLMSFLRLHGYSSRVSAADVVYGVTALLESFVVSDGSCASKQFGEAYDALSLNNLDKLKVGMQQAIKVQRAILRQGSTAITKSGSIRSGKSSDG
ncbi:hypothetical protein GH714_026147 [Hevea brasiliensis]|uniref:Uncharacterized protein n=1 Tax=Hevea brasiliensis TaxID=3981 RepID=A0A6A6KAP3_HEVBR|nr:hypothetical protein GH714_026147 [Hevea brasiliensis]